MTTYMTKGEAAAYLRVSESTVDRWVRAGTLTRYRIKGVPSVRFLLTELDSLITPVPNRPDETE